LGDGLSPRLGVYDIYTLRLVVRIVGKIRRSGTSGVVKQSECVRVILGCQAGRKRLIETYVGMVVVLLPDPFRGIGGVEELHGD